MKTRFASYLVNTEILASSLISWTLYSIFIPFMNLIMMGFIRQISFKSQNQEVSLSLLFDAEQLLAPFILQNTQPQDRDANI